LDIPLESDLMIVSAFDPERALLERLRAGDGRAFATLVDQLHGPLLALARTFTSSRAVAEDVVQETWLAVIRGIDRFEGRSTLRTWIYGILVRRARTMAAREARHHDPRPNGPEWSPGLGRVGLWEEGQRPEPWRLDDPAMLQQGEEALEVVRAALDALPPNQRQVVLLRDVEGCSAKEVCNILGLSETNQRVLLHRGRSAVRKALDRYVRDGIRPRRPRIPGRVWQPVREGA
jgi:RNA polymerase sigma-70 factor (ECF subfamily)